MHTMIRIRPEVTEPAGSSLGVYGLRVYGVDDAKNYLYQADSSWPELRVEQRVVDRLPNWPDELDDAAGRFCLSGATSTMRITSDPFRLEAVTTHHWTDAELVHPFMAMSGAVINSWLGRMAFHAGAFVAGGDGAGSASCGADRDAWAVLGAKGRGKSTALAHLASRGAAIVTDDVLVLDDDGVAFAGPRCIDLRRDAGAVLGGENLGVVGSRERWRITSAPRAGRARLAGWILPEWGPQVRLRRLPPTERFAAVLAHLAISRPPRDPQQVLRLATLPVYEFTRPRDWAALPEATEHLLALASGQRTFH